MKNSVILPESDESDRLLHRIRSFVRRQGRPMKGQEHTLENYWPMMSVESNEEPVDFVGLLDHDTSVALGTGFDVETLLVIMTKACPEQNLPDVEVHSPGVGACLVSARKEGVESPRIMCHDVVEILHKIIPDNSSPMVQLFFPDPWHRARCNKRRTVQVPFAKHILNKLKLDGMFRMTTDQEVYTEHVLKVMSSTDGYRNQSESSDYIPRPGSCPVTKFR